VCAAGGVIRQQQATAASPFSVLNRKNSNGNRPVFYRKMTTWPKIEHASML
jgi:hypothetical protein